jgi:hypothetical protein
VLLASVKLYTESCSDCSTEGAEVLLRGERSIDYRHGAASLILSRHGIPCLTGTLDLPGTTEYASTSSFDFTEERPLGDCFQVKKATQSLNSCAAQGALNARLTDGGLITWKGSGEWSPRLSHGICVDWLSDSAFAWTCSLKGPVSGGPGAQWTLASCGINPAFSVACP